jgi:shikimate dehydrogenase
MKIFGLIGYPLAHSFSKKYFEEKFARENISGCRYENFPLREIEELTGLLQSQPELTGLNVTIPHKEAVIPLLHETDELAAAIGAVNTIRIKEGRMQGFNTDVFGFMQSVKDWLQPDHAAALILGTGGSSKAVAYGFKKMGLEYDFVSRNPDEGELRYEDLDQAVLRRYKVLVNTTPLGMYPHTDDCPPIPYEFITRSHLLFDLIYNPDETLFLKKGKEKGAAVHNGLSMLRLQAEKSWEIWNE